MERGHSRGRRREIGSDRGARGHGGRGSHHFRGNHRLQGRTEQLYGGPPSQTPFTGQMIGAHCSPDIRYRMQQPNNQWAGNMGQRQSLDLPHPVHMQQQIFHEQGGYVHPPRQAKFIEFTDTRYGERYGEHDRRNDTNTHGRPPQILQNVGNEPFAHRRRPEMQQNVGNEPFPTPPSIYTQPKDVRPKEKSYAEHEQGRGISHFQAQEEYVGDYGIIGRGMEQHRGSQQNYLKKSHQEQDEKVTSSASSKVSVEPSTVGCPPVKRDEKSTPKECNTLLSITEEMTKMIIPIQDSPYAEFCALVVMDLKIRSGDPHYHIQLDKVGRFVCCFMNTSGGIVLIKASELVPATVIEEWEDIIKQNLAKFVPDNIFHDCIQIDVEEVTEGYDIQICVSASTEHVVYDSHLYERQATSSREVRKIPAIKKLLSKLKNNKEPFSRKINLINMAYNDNLQYASEKVTIEFKCYKHDIRFCDMITKIKEDKAYKGKKISVIERVIFSFANNMGGILVIGIYEDRRTKQKSVQGQLLTELEQEEFRKIIDSWMQNCPHTGKKRIWGDGTYVPKEGLNWKIEFHPILKCPSNNRRALIKLQVLPYEYGVFAEQPESFVLTDEGCVRAQSIEEFDVLHKGSSDDKYFDTPIQTNMPSSPKFAAWAEEHFSQEELESFASKLKSSENYHEIVKSYDFSWEKHSSHWLKDRELDSTYNLADKISDLAKSRMLTPSHPYRFVPDMKSMERRISPELKVNQISEVIKERCGKMGVGIGIRRILLAFPNNANFAKDVENHVWDFIVIGENGQLFLIACVNGDCKQTASYIKTTIRVLKKHLVQAYAKHRNLCSIKDDLEISFMSVTGLSLDLNTATLTDIDRTFPRVSTTKLQPLQICLASVLLEGDTYLKNRFGNEYLSILTKEQIERMVDLDKYDICVFEGPPGSGKTIMGLHIFDRLAKELAIETNEMLYICPNTALANYIAIQKLCEVVTVKDGDKLKKEISDTSFRDIKFVVIDDAHRMNITKDAWFEYFDRSRKFNIRTRIFLDSTYQNYNEITEVNLKKIVPEYAGQCPVDIHINIPEPLTEMLRNTKKIYSFFRANVECSENAGKLKCRHNIEGEDVHIHHFEKLFVPSDKNPILNLVKTIMEPDEGNESAHHHEAKHIAILVDDSGKDKGTWEVNFLHKLFKQFYPETNVQDAEKCPVIGLLVDKLGNFTGLDADVIIFIGHRYGPHQNIPFVGNNKYKLFVTSRAISRLDLVFQKMANEVVDSQFSEDLKLKQDTIATLDLLYIFGLDELLTVGDTRLIHYLPFNWKGNDIMSLIHQKLKNKQITSGEIEMWCNRPTNWSNLKVLLVDMFGLLDRAVSAFDDKHSQYQDTFTSLLRVEVVLYQQKMLFLLPSIVKCLILTSSVCPASLLYWILSEELREKDEHDQALKTCTHLISALVGLVIDLLKKNNTYKFSQMLSLTLIAYLKYFLRDYKPYIEICMNSDLFLDDAYYIQNLIICLPFLYISEVSSQKFVLENIKNTKTEWKGYVDILRTKALIPKHVVDSWLSTYTDASTNETLVEHFERCVRALRDDSKVFDMLMEEQKDLMKHWSREPSFYSIFLSAHFWERTTICGGILKRICSSFHREIPKGLLIRIIHVILFKLQCPADKELEIFRAIQVQDQMELSEILSIQEENFQTDPLITTGHEQFVNVIEKLKW